MNSSPQQLVEHFFRHESANLVSVLTRAFGVARLDIIEDMVQVSMLDAMNAWKLKGVPDNPAGWIHKVAKNKILDALRREKIHEKAILFSRYSESESSSLVDQWLDGENQQDSLLQMIFVCCHPILDRASQIALTLKILCGFGVDEIARGQLNSKEATRKRIQRAKKKLAENQIQLDVPDQNELSQRLNVVHDVLYLMFNEGYSTSTGHEPIRDDICEEAARLCHLLCTHEEFSSPTTKALMALMLFHASRLESRMDRDNTIVLLQDQDRNLWDRKLIRIAEYWLGNSKTERVSRFHLEAAIAMQHCRAECFEETDWPRIVKIYTRLIELYPSSIYILNRAIAKGQAGDVDDALSDLDEIENARELRSYFLFHCARAQLFELKRDYSSAIDCYLTALSKSLAPHERELLKQKINECQKRKESGR